MLIELKRRWTDGATHLVFDSTELLERLAVSIPRPRINLILYYGVLGPRSAWRKRVVPDPQRGHEQAEADIARRPSDYLWADLMRRSFGFDVLSCSRCGGRMRLVALIDQPSVIRRILRHLELPTEVPAPRPARDPPLQELGPTAHSPDEVFQIDFGA